MGVRRPVVRDDGKVYESVTAAAADVVGNPSNIVVAIKSNGISYGHRWRYLGEGETADKVRKFAAKVMESMGKQAAAEMVELMDEVYRYGYR